MMKNKLQLLLLLAILVGMASCNFFTHQSTKSAGEEVKTVVDSIPHSFVKYLYGIIPADSFRCEREVVKKNENLSAILTKKGVSYSTIHKISQDYGQVFNAKSLRAGNSYSLFYSKYADSTLVPQYFIYEQNSADYVVFNLRDSLSIYVGKKPIDTLQYVVSGAVNSSLWNALADLKVNPLLSVGLADVYAWSIDFFGIAQGDQFKVIYDETLVDSVPTGNLHIVAAQFNTLGERFYAIPFEQDSIVSFYDEEGRSLRKAFLKAPLKYSRVSSKFTNSRYHPILKISRPHHGVDYAAPSGTPVHTIGDGTVIQKGYEALGGGNFIKIKHNAVYTTSYMHLKGFAKGIHVGQRVKQGDLIGYVGMTGLATGPHLDFRVYKNGTAINPLTMEAPPVQPISAENKAAFELVKNKYMQVLDSIPARSLEQMPSYVPHASRKK